VRSRRFEEKLKRPWNARRGKIGTVHKKCIVAARVRAIRGGRKDFKGVKGGRKVAREEWVGFTEKRQY